MDDLILETLQSHPVEFDNRMGVPEVAITNALMHDCSQNYTTGAFTFYIHAYFVLFTCVIALTNKD